MQAVISHQNFAHYPNAHLNIAIESNLKNIESISNDAIDWELFSQNLLKDDFRDPNDNLFMLDITNPFLDDDLTLEDNSSKIILSIVSEIDLVNSKDTLLKEACEKINFFYVRKEFSLIDLQKVTFLLVKYLSLSNLSQAVCDENSISKICNSYEKITFEKCFKTNSADARFIELRQENLVSSSRVAFLKQIMKGFRILEIDQNLLLPQKIDFFDNISKKSIQDLKSLAEEAKLKSLIDEFKGFKTGVHY